MQTETDIHIAYTQKTKSYKHLQHDVNWCVTALKAAPQTAINFTPKELFSRQPLWGQHGVRTKGVEVMQIADKVERRVVQCM